MGRMTAIAPYAPAQPPQLWRSPLTARKTSQPVIFSRRWQHRNTQAFTAAAPFAVGVQLRAEAFNLTNTPQFT